MHFKNNFPINWSQRTTLLYAVLKDACTLWCKQTREKRVVEYVKEKRAFTLWQQMALNSRNAAVTPETTQLQLFITHLNDLNSHSDFFIRYSVVHSAKYLNI